MLQSDVSVSHDDDDNSDSNSNIEGNVLYCCCHDKVIVRIDLFVQLMNEE